MSKDAELSILKPMLQRVQNGGHELRNRFVRHAMICVALSLPGSPGLSQQRTDADLTPTGNLGKALREEGLRHSQAAKMTTDLSDLTGARLSGSPALTAGYLWAINHLRQIGMRNVHLEDCGELGLGCA